MTKEEMKDTVNECNKTSVSHYGKAIGWGVVGFYALRQVFKNYGLSCSHNTIAKCLQAALDNDKNDKEET